MKRAVVSSVAAFSILFGACFLVRSADGQEPSLPSSEGGVPTTAADPDSGGPAPAPTPPPGFMLVPIPVDAGAPDAADGGSKVNAPLTVGVGTDMARFRYANTWDLNLEGGGGYVFGDVDKWTGFVRARPGVLIVRNDDFYQAGLTAEYLGMLKRPAFGAQVEYLHLQLGTWAQLGGSIDTKGRPGGNLAVGLSIIGVEAQVREFDASSDPAFCLLGKIRLPIGIFIYGLQTKK
jgi:hypothetical protein